MRSSRFLACMHAPCCESMDPSARADDDVVGCGGILAEHVKEGDTVTTVYMTDGSRCYGRTSMVKLISIVYGSPSPQELVRAQRPDDV